MKQFNIIIEGAPATIWVDGDTLTVVFEDGTKERYYNPERTERNGQTVREWKIRDDVTIKLM